MLVNKPDEWVRIALQRFQVQLPHERKPDHNESKESIEKIQETLITLSEQRFPLVMQGLSKLIKEPAFINSFPSNKKDKIGESNVIVLSTIEKCLCRYPEQCSRLEDDVLSNLLPSIIQYVLQTFDFPHAPEVQKMAAKVVAHISSFHFSAIFNKVSYRLHQLSSVDDSSNDVNSLTLIRYLKLTPSSLLILLEECLDTFKSLKKPAKLVLISSLEKALWNWIKYNADEFAKVQRSPSKKLSELCDKFFEILASFAESTKRKAAVWPLQIMLLMLSPDTLKAVAPVKPGEKLQDAHLEIKREFLQNLKTALTCAKGLTESSAIACVKLCKCATYVKPEDNSVLCFLVLTVMNELKALLFNISKPFVCVSQTTIPVETLMVDCFVSSFRINYRNSQHFDDCLSPTTPVIFSVVYVKGLYTIVRQRPLHWWPTLKVMYSKADSVRNLFENTLEKFRGLENSHGASRMSVLYKGKEKRGKEEEVGTLKAEKELLLWLVRLFRMEPAFAFSNTEKRSIEVHQCSQKLLLGLVHLILSSHFGKDVSQEASQTLLVLHSPENVQLWNPTEPIYSFWEISSECVHAIGEALVNHGAKDLWLLRYMRKLMACRDEFILNNKDDPNFCCHSLVTSSARVKLEEVFLQFLWNPDADAILTALSCLKFLCTEVNTVSNQSMDNIAQLNLVTCIFAVYEELANLANGISTGRLALQKRIMAILRNVKVQTSGNKSAWDSTYARWRKLTHALINFPKEEIPGEPAQSSKSIRRRTTRFSQSGKISPESVEGYINEWNYMTGFLCSLGAVCFKEHPQLSRRISRSRSGIGKLQRMPSISQPEEAETVKGFVGELLRLSVCTNEHIGPKIRLIIKDLIGQELTEALYSTLFKEIRRNLEGFFTSGGQAIVQDLNTCFVDQVIAIMKHILENKNAVSVECFKMEIIEPIIISIIRYTRNLPFTSRSLIIKSRICQLVVTLMSHRDEVLFFQEIKFRNKLVEYLSDWVAHATIEETEMSYEITVNSRYLDECAMKAISQLLSCLPLQPEATDVDIMEAKSELFLKYFTLFLNLLHKCVGPEEESNASTLEKKRQKSVLTYHDNLHQCTVAAMSNLLSANIDAGLTHAIGLGYHVDLATRAIFMEVLMKILNQGTEFDTLAETATRDRYEQLANLMATMGEKGELLLAVALANVVPSNEQDDLAQVLVTLFDAMNLLYQFLWNVLSQEVRNCEGYHVLFRGNTLATKVTTFCFKIYGTNYIHSLLGPLIKPLLKQENLNTTFELDPSRLEAGESLEENTQNVINLAEKFLNRFFASLDDFPSALKLLCYCLKKVVSQRFRQHQAEAVGSAIFLRFINPAINSPQMLGIVEHPPPENIRRGLMFLSKILQSLANNMLFTKEKHMEPLNEFVKENLTKTQQYFEKISLHRPSFKGGSRDVYSFVSDANILSLHRMLWNSQEKIGLYMAARGEFKIYGRGVFEKLTTLLAHLGPSDPQRLQVQKKWATQGGSSDFEEFMARHADSGERDLEEIRNLKIFYQEGRSKNGNPVFYFIARRLRGDVISTERLIYYVLLTLKSSFGQAWELVCDVTQTSTSNQTKLMSLTKTLAVLPVNTVNNLQAVYVYNMNTALKEYIKINERFFSHFKHHSQVIVIDNLSKFSEYISPEELKLPSTTTSLEKDLNVFSAIKIHYRISVLIKIGPNCIQIQTTEKHKVLGYSFHIKDIFLPNEIEDVFCQTTDDNLFGLKFKTSASVLYMSNESDQIVQAVTHLKKRWLMSQPNETAATKKILPKDVPGTLLNIALLNLGTRDPNLRLAAYNLLCALTTVFHFKIEERLFEGTGLCIPANNTIFIVGISSNLASKEPHLTLEFLQECITGFKKSNHELKHLCLEYMAPWFPNLSRYCKEPSKGAKRAQVNAILEDLIELTIAEKGAMYPSIQAKIWGNMGKVTELVDTVLDSFIKASTAGGLGSTKAEVMADTSVALATANVQVVSSKFLNRLLMLIRKTSITPTVRLDEHLMWEDIAILSRYLLMLSFNDSLDVANNLPYLFHIIISLVCMGPLFLRATIHGILINVIQSLSTCTSLELPDETKRLLRLRMSEFSLPKFYLLFGISQVKSAPVRAFQSSFCGGRHMINSRDSEKIHMTSIQTIANSLLEVVEACVKDIPKCTWLDTWIKLTMEFAFQPNPPLQGRAVIVYGCVSKEIDDAKIRQLLLVFIKALNDFNDVSLIEGVIMCFTKLLTILDKTSKFHTASFWIAIATLQLAESALYPAGLALLEQSLLTLESQGVFDTESVDGVLLDFRKDPRMEWHCKQLDHIIGVSFSNNFHFALVAYLLKGLRHGSSSTNTRAIRILNLMLNIAGKHKTHHAREKFAVYKETIPYLAALLIVSDEIRTKLRPSSSLHARPKPIPESQSSVTPPSSMPVSPVTITIESPISPGPANISEVETEVFIWPAEVENRLLDPGVVNDTQTQALLLTTLSTLVRHTKDDLLEKFLFEVLAEASLVFPKVFPVIYSLISSKLAMVLGHSQDVACLQAVQTIMQSTISLNFAEKQLGTNFLTGFGFDGFSQFAGPFYDQGELQYETRAQIFVRFAEGVLETCGGILDDSLRASCMSLAKPVPEKVNDHPPLLVKSSLSSSLTSIPDDPVLKDSLSTSAMKRSLSSRRKSAAKERKEKDRSRSKRSLTQRVVDRELKKALAHGNSDV